MNVVWIVLDSLSFDATPFAETGIDTMPKLKELSARNGVIFTQAYAPGPTSPSSHSSFFTGELPSVTGMHEANPYFTSELPTIADALSERRSFAISSNPFIFNGLCDGFDVVDDLQSREFMLFTSASDPITDGAQAYSESRSEQYSKFLFKKGKPLRSLLNGISYKLYRRLQDEVALKDAPQDPREHQFAETMTERIRAFLNEDSSDAFVFANYMDVHAPLNASDEAIQRFAPEWSREELPIGVSGQNIHKQIQNGNSEIGERMYDLYKAAIWDLDRIVGPLIGDLVEDGAFVVVTADHGNWFRRDRELDEERIHVPLVTFVPSEPARTVDKTVNLRSLTRTTMEVLTQDDGGFKGVDLTNVSEDQLSITELIHDPETPGSPVEPYGNEEQSIQYDIAAIKGGSRVDYVGGKIRKVRDSGGTEELEKQIRELRARDVTFDPINKTNNSAREERLRQLGYLE